MESSYWKTLWKLLQTKSEPIELCNSCSSVSEFENSIKDVCSVEGKLPSHVFDCHVWAEVSMCEVCATYREHF